MLSLPPLVDRDLARRRAGQLCRRSCLSSINAIDYLSEERRTCSFRNWTARSCTGVSVSCGIILYHSSAGCIIAPGAARGYTVSVAQVRIFFVECRRLPAGSADTKPLRHDHAEWQNSLLRSQKSTDAGVTFGGVARNLLHRLTKQKVCAERLCVADDEPIGCRGEEAMERRSFDDGYGRRDLDPMSRADDRPPARERGGFAAAGAAGHDPRSRADRPQAARIVPLERPWLSPRRRQVALPSRVRAAPDPAVVGQDVRRRLYRQFSRRHSGAHRSESAPQLGERPRPGRGGRRSRHADPVRRRVCSAMRSASVPSSRRSSRCSTTPSTASSSTAKPPRSARACCAGSARRPRRGGC